MSKPKNYTIQAPNATACNILRTWLKAVGAPVRTSTVAGFDLTVTRADGTDMEVQVTKRQDETMPGHGVQVLAGSITGKSTKTAMAAFYAVTDAAGYVRAQPVSRGAEPALNAQGNYRKLHYKDEDFLVAIRHTEFRRSPNPDNDRWTKYRVVMEKAAASFMRKNFDLCARHGLTIDDVMQYVRCYVVNFCARYEIPEAETTFCDNERKCYAYLRQQCYTAPTSSLRAILLKKERSTLPDSETVGICLFGVPDADTEVSPNPVEPGHVVASTRLQERLQELPRGRRLELLRAAAANKSLDSATRAEAKRLLYLAESADAGNTGVKEDKNLTSSNSLSASE